MRSVTIAVVGLLFWSSGTLAAAQPEMPQGLWEAFSAARHAIEADGTGYIAHNYRNDQRIAFHDGGVEVAPPGRDLTWSWGLKLIGYGTPGQINPVADPQLHVAGTRLEYRRGPLTEWYENKPVGLEQGFTLESPPQPGAERLVLALSLNGGLTPEWEQPEQSLRFHTPAGGYALSYRDLKVVDATGNPLPAHLAVKGQTLEIHLDARGARWPIVVDPLVVNEQKVTANDSAANDKFGHSVALSGDAALIGAPDNDDGGADSGAAYVFVRSGSTWSLQTKLIPNDATAGAEFGRSVALDGDTALIGAPTKSATSSEDAAYVFVRGEPGWAQQVKLDCPGGGLAGYAVALSGDTALIGAPYYNRGAPYGRSGAAHVYVRNVTDWAREDFILPSGGGDGALFGLSVALSGDTALIGAPGEDAWVTDGGVAYFFERSGSDWTETRRQANPRGSSTASGEKFGWSVALDGDTALISAPFADVLSTTTVRVYRRYYGLWYAEGQMQAQAGTAFGYSMALSGGTALIGAPNDDDGGTDSGSIYVFTFYGTVWTPQAKHTAVAPAANDHFGRSVALSGDTALVGAEDDDTSDTDTGSASVFVRLGSSWGPQGLLSADDGQTDAVFGSSVALDGDTAVIGAPNNYQAPDTPPPGSAYVFIRSGANWILQAKLAEGMERSGFGFSVALSGETVLVGAPGDDNSSGSSNGSAYVFVRSGTSWILQQKLSPDAGWVQSFGWSVALDGDTALIGVPEDSSNGQRKGSAYVFSRSGSSWSREEKLTAADAAEIDEFGRSVALAGDTALVGAPFDDDAGDASGSAYVFTRSDGTWGQEAKLTASDAVAGDDFGWYVALSGDTALIGAIAWDRPNANGSAYVFVRSGAGWSQQAKLSGDNAGVQDMFGWSAALDGGIALIGVPHESWWMYGGSVYVFVRSGTSWIPHDVLTASDAAANYFFGESVALDGSIALVGAVGGDGVEFRGAAYFYTFSADIDDDGTPNADDNCVLVANPDQTDFDGDGMGDICDNCIMLANADQRDTDADGYGNRCDGDFNQDLKTNAFDVAILKADYGKTGDLKTDLNSDNKVNAFDVSILKALFGQPPGPSALVP